MIKSVKCISAMVLSVLSISAFAESQFDPQAAFVRQTVTSFMDKYNVPGVAVELYVDGKPYEYYYGYADRANKTPVSNRTIFELGSISKVMTSILLAQEVDWAKMSFTDPVTKYVKDLPASFNKIKLQDLATHTSGLPFNPPKNIETHAELKNYLANWSSDADPGDEWTYSNIGIGLLGNAIEVSTEKDLDKLYHRHILNPLRMIIGMEIPKKLTKYYAQGYNQNGNPVPHVAPGLFPAAYNFKASAEDMQRFLSAAIGLPGTPPRLFYPIRMTQSVYVKLADVSQGLGWQIHPLSDGYVSDLLNVPETQDFGPLDVQEIYARPLFNGDALIDKTGATGGFRAYIAVLPNKKSGIVILANKNVSNGAIVATARKLLFKLTGLT
jgi:beta-lactamase class C